MTAIPATTHSPIPDTTSEAAPAARRASRSIWASRILGGLVTLFLLLDAVIKVLQVGPAVEGTVQVGYPQSVVFPLGVVELVCLALYVIPRTAILGALLWTGYLGGAVATHVRIGDPLLSHVLAPVYVATFLWGVLWLRNPTLRALVPWNRRTGRDAA